MFAQRGSAVVHGLRRVFDEADLVARRGGEAVTGGERGGRVVQVSFEFAHQEEDDRVGGASVGGKEGAVGG